MSSKIQEPIIIDSDKVEALSTQTQEIDSGNKR